MSCFFFRYVFKRNKFFVNTLAGKSQVVKVMIVNNLNSMANIYTSNAVASTRYASSTSGARNVQKRDELSLSNEAQSFSDLLNKLKGTSDVREDKVSDIQAKIASGQYFVSAQDIAASILTNRF